ncbi:MAG: ketol-acid reductoisomerase, partial [Candidatus Omnitrophica bacterium]|nr:ketol-acid reductoisomerase [Candidatus Omnitrophota bacterium]
CYGDLTRGPRVIDQRVRRTMKKLLNEIRSGRFAREWIKENEEGRPNFNRLLQEEDNHPIEEIGKRLREMMPWMKR